MSKAVASWRERNAQTYIDSVSLCGLYSSACLYFTTVTSMMPIFEIDYPVTRTIRPRWIAPVSYAGAVVVIILLTILNAALVGYETVNVVQSNFNFTQELWFHRFIPYGNPRSGSLCDPHLLAIGDQFKFLNGFLDWTVHSIINLKNNSTAAAIPYSGIALDRCEITSVAAYFGDSINMSNEEFHAVLECQLDEFKFTAWSSLSQGVMLKPIPYSLMIFLDQPYDPRYDICSRILSAASLDVEIHGPSFHLNHRTAYIQLDLTTPCAARLVSSTNCGQKPPRFDRTTWVIIDGVEDSAPTPNIPLKQSEDPTLWNLAHTLYFMGRLDLGIESINNFLVHKEAIPTVIANFSSSKLDQVLRDLEAYQTKYPLTISSSSTTVQADYLCREQRLKSPGSLFISVLVAVLSMFTGTWTLYLCMLSTWVKRDQEANTCLAHVRGLYQSIEANESRYQSSERFKEKRATSVPDWWREAENAEGTV
ncbi:hypothetical protein CPB83DRAFT_855887 [Crepidotus variabilis]|uniref:Uncharacterized protein n=1 Tax=Crepidotus variabilis TaxID=179855 RepID=A0A9P6JPH5_9AGAR|nr:hypothetical protein CPB83DRAFT_855887 [Crepidotus variabilis]